MLKSLVLLAAQRLVASLAPGDCAFVGIYGEQDDFAVVLLEDADGDSLFVSDELPSKPQLAVRRSFAAKAHVRDAQSLGRNSGLLTYHMVSIGLLRLCITILR